MALGLIISPWREPRSQEHQASPELFKIHSSQWLHQHISYLFIHRNILELHCSSLHHILDIVIFYLDMLLLVMEHRVLKQFHTTLVVGIYTSDIQLEIK